MSRSTQVERGEQTMGAVLKKLTKRAQRPEVIAGKLPKKLQVSPAWVARLLKRAVNEGQAVVERKGREKLYRLPHPQGLTSSDARPLADAAQG